MKKWLWLEDQPATVSDLKFTLSKILQLPIEMFFEPASLINELVKLKIEGGQKLQEVGLILDVLLSAQRYIICPSKWSGRKDESYSTQHGGYDAGLLLYEKLVLGLNISKTPIWNPPPPVIFLTVIPAEYQEAPQKRLSNIKEEWSRANGVEVHAAQVTWLRKWDADEAKLREIFTAWGEL